MAELCYTERMDSIEDKTVTRERELEEKISGRIGKLCLVRDAVWFHNNADDGAYGSVCAHSSYQPTAENREEILFPDTPFILLDVAQGELLRSSGDHASSRPEIGTEFRPCYKILLGDEIKFISNRAEFQEYHQAVRWEKL